MMGGRPARRGASEGSSPDSKRRAGSVVDGSVGGEATSEALGGWGSGEDRVRAFP